MKKGGKCIWVCERGPRKGKKCSKPTGKDLVGEFYELCIKHSNIRYRRDWADK